MEHELVNIMLMVDMAVGGSDPQCMALVLVLSSLPSVGSLVGQPRGHVISEILLINLNVPRP